MDKPKEFKIESDGRDLYVVVDGVRVAKRGHPGTPEAGTSISLAPGWTVTSNEDPARSRSRTTARGCTESTRSSPALLAMEAQRRARASLVDERNREASTLWPPAGPSARRWPPKAAGSRPRPRPSAMAELVGAGTDSERPVRWLIALMVLCCDLLLLH